MAGTYYDRFVKVASNRNIKQKVMDEAERFQDVRFMHVSYTDSGWIGYGDRPKEYKEVMGPETGNEYLEWVKPLDVVDNVYLHDRIKHDLLHGTQPALTGVKVIYAQAGFEIGRKKTTKNLMKKFMLGALLVGGTALALDDAGVIDLKSGWDALTKKTEVPVVR